MRPFKHTNAKTVEEASVMLRDKQSRIIAGGTDLLGTLKDGVLPVHPARVVNLKSTEGLDYIKVENGSLKIGALTKLSEIVENPIVAEKFQALSQAAKSVATPNIRNMGTIGGNLSQLPRCWYFRKAENRFNCLRKGGDECYAILGDNRYHSAFGGKRCKDSPCTSECPAGTDIPGYMQELRNGDWDKAAQIIMRVNPFPAITSRVCAHFCQSACNRCQTDENVLVGGVERALGDYILDNGKKFFATPKAKTGKSVAILGSGPSGLSAAYFLRLAGNKVTVYEEKDEVGGMLMYAIPAYRLPKDLVRKATNLLEGMGVEFKTGVKIGRDITAGELEKKYDSVCVATGAWKRPVIGIAGEELTVFGLDFLVEIKNWMDGKVGEEVLVVGAGEAAGVVCRAPVVCVRVEREPLPQEVCRIVRVERVVRNGGVFRPPRLDHVRDVLCGAVHVCVPRHLVLFGGVPEQGLLGEVAVREHDGPVEQRVVERHALGEVRDGGGALHGDCGDG